MYYGSDLLVDQLGQLGIDLVMLNPGASIRGLHDSLVRSARPEMILALHEEIAVGLAHGYAKSAGNPAAVFVHDLVGLQHASMGMFNAWADAAPMLVVGGSGPRDAARRRPWIDWVHTGLPQGALVRDVVKWDDEPASLAAVPDSLSRGLQLALTAPQGPVYLSIDVALQECEVQDADLREMPALSPPRASTVAAPRATSEELAEALRRAARPVVLVDLPVRGLASALTDLAELTAVAVVDLGGGANFPSSHFANQTHRTREVLAQADLVVALNVRDLLWAIGDTDQRTRTVQQHTDAALYSVALSELQVRGFVVARSHLPRARHVVGDPLLLVEDVVAALSAGGARGRAAEQRDDEAAGVARARRQAWDLARSSSRDGTIHPAFLAASVWDIARTGPWQLANGRLDGWVQRLWDIEADSQFLGLSGGHGLGYGLPASLGAALAQRDTDTLVINLQGDGDLMYTPSALWTAARYQLPLLTVVQNNRSYGKDEMHQREVAHTRGRSTDLVGVGIHLDDPEISYAKLAEAQGVEGLGPIESPAELIPALKEAERITRVERRPVLVDVVCPIPGTQ